jgi:hypothetical protein
VVIAHELSAKVSFSFNAKPLLMAGLDTAFNSVVKKFKDQGKPDQDIEEIETQLPDDPGDCVQIGSDKLGWTQFPAKSLIGTWDDFRENLRRFE